MNQHQDGRCGARCVDGHACRKWPMKFSKRCELHGSANRQSRAAAERKRIESEALATVTRLDARPVKQPVVELQKLAGEHVMLKNMILAEFLAQSPGESPEFVRYLSDTLEKCGRLLAEMVRLGIERDTVVITERQVDLFAEVMREILFGLDLTSEQRRIVPDVVRHHLATLPTEEAE